MTSTAQRQPEAGVTELLAVGKEAPDFTLDGSEEGQVSLIDFRGKPIVLVFYPADWSPVCGDQLALYNEIVPELKAYGAQVLGISVDSAWSHKAYAESRHLRFPLLSDFNPRGAVGQSYGVYNEAAGEDRRALFVIDGDGAIQWNFLSSNWENPGAAGILKALKTLPNKEKSQ